MMRIDDVNRGAWAFAVIQALKDLGRPGEILTGRAALERDRAWEWFRSKDESPGSYRWICHKLDLPADRYLEQIERGEYNLNLHRVAWTATQIRGLLRRHGLTISQMARELGAPRDSLAPLVRGQVQKSRYAFSLNRYLARLEATA